MIDDNRTISADHMKRLKVLIVDPNAYMRGVVADSLRRLQVSSISAAASALESFNQGQEVREPVLLE